MNQQTKQPPEEKFRVGGVSASVFRYDTVQQGGLVITRYRTVLDRTYKDNQGNWQHTNCYDVNDIPKATLAMQKAYDYIMTAAKQKKNGESSLPEPPPIVEEEIQ